MHIRPSALLFALIIAGLPVAPSRADAIPPPMDLSETQLALMGVWQEETATSQGWGHGHGSARRTVAFANADMSILTLSGIVPSNDYTTHVIKGAWSAERVDDKTLKITLSQGEGRGTVLTIIFDGPDNFIMTNEETPGLAAARFTRIVKLPR